MEGWIDVKILIWKSKHENVLIDATDNLAAFYKMFLLCKEADYYGYLDEKNNNKLYTEACLGNKQSAKSLIYERRYFEYEGWDLVDVIDPTLENK